MTSNDLTRIDWPHGDYDQVSGLVICPDGKPCEHEAEWAHPCDRDVAYNPDEPENQADPRPGADYMCERMPPPDGWS